VLAIIVSASAQSIRKEMKTANLAVKLTFDTETTKVESKAEKGVR